MVHPQFSSSLELIIQIITAKGGSRRAAVTPPTHTHTERRPCSLQDVILADKGSFSLCKKSIGEATKGGGACGGENDDPVNKRSQPLLETVHFVWGHVGLILTLSVGSGRCRGQRADH